MAHERYRNLIRELAISEAQVQGLRDDRTFFVDGIPPDWGTCDQGGCYAVAMYVSRAALEQRAGRITIIRGATHRHEFDVAKLIQHAKRVNGGRLPTPRGGHSHLATVKHAALGNFVESRGLVIPVSASLTSTAVSSNPGSQKESQHV
ncbi:MAG: hypothetical protein HQL97_10720 [Magnetococcales bacterium]|nr:hypothetical protein [Magnetococcales bacterium]